MDIFIGISLTIVIAAVVAGILQYLKQPLIIGHIITGLIVGPFLFSNTQFKEVVDSLSQFGIALLLFIIGLSLTPKVIKEVGKVSLFAGLGQILLVSTVGFGLAKLLGISTVTSIYLALALTFSSTIIIMKLLSDKKELTKLYSKISIGVLLIQDLVVALILIAISALSGGNASWQSISLTVLKGILALDLIMIFAIYVVPYFTAQFAKSQEFLFLFSIGWGLGFATLFHYLGFSMEIGALVAGVALSTSPYHFEISTRLRPLRDFFVVLFFILLGSKIDLAQFRQSWLFILIFSAFVILIKPLLVILLTGIQGYKKKVSFLAAVNFSQISEFSVILLMIGNENGHVANNMVSLITIVSLISIAASAYLVLYSQKVFPFFQRFIFERKTANNKRVQSETYDVILFGCNRVGFDFLEIFKGLDKKFLIIDFDPEMVKKLEALGFNCRYGDADDNEFLEELNLNTVKMAISTVPSFDTNNSLISKIRQENKEAVVIVISHESDEAIGLYESGATYVITPHFLGGKYASMLISKYGFNVKDFVSEKEKHIKSLQKRTEIETPQLMPEIYR